MIFFKNVLRKVNLYSDRQGTKNALALHRRGEVRRDGLTLVQASHRLEIEWRARDIHPCDRGCKGAEYELEFTEQSLADTEAALSRLFKELPEIDVIEFRVIHPMYESSAVRWSAPLLYLEFGGHPRGQVMAPRHNCSPFHSACASFSRSG